VEKEAFIPIFSHNDADGLAAGSIVAKAVHRLGGKFLLRIIPRIDDRFLDRHEKAGFKFCVFTEIGSGYLDMLGKLSSEAVLVIDHHKPLPLDFPSLIHVNPHPYGFDGARDISGAGMCYLVVRELSRENVDLAPLAVVGALGDLQDKNEARTLQGLNLEAVKDAEANGLLEVSTDLLFYGRETRPLPQALATTLNPFIPGLSGEEDRCLGFLSQLDIPLKAGERWRTISDLTPDEKQKIFSEITIYLSSKGFAQNTILSLLGGVYTFKKEDKWTPLRDGREYAALLNACAKMEKTGLGVALCLGERGKALEEAQAVLNDYRRTLGRTVTSLMEDKDRVKTLLKLTLIRGHGLVDENLISPIATILSGSGSFPPSKPLLALTNTRTGEVKASIRASQTLVDRSLNLGVIMQAAAEKVGGKGGGHNVAAGATIPPEGEESFVQLVEQMVGESLT
jgi:RecJ-like exonuclease